MATKKTNKFSKVIFAAMSKRRFYLREHIIKYILDCGYTPTCAFMMFSYFLLDTVERDFLIEANNELIKRADELWVFGPISDGVSEEIKLAEKQKIPLKYFNIKKGTYFTEVNKSEAKHE